MNNLSPELESVFAKPLADPSVLFVDACKVQIDVGDDSLPFVIVVTEEHDGVFLLYEHSGAEVASVPITALINIDLEDSNTLSLFDGTTELIISTSRARDIHAILSRIAFQRSPTSPRPTPLVDRPTSPIAAAISAARAQGASFDSSIQVLPAALDFADASAGEQPLQTATSDDTDLRGEGFGDSKLARHPEEDTTWPDAPPLALPTPRSATPSPWPDVQRGSLTDAAGSLLDRAPSSRGGGISPPPPSCGDPSAAVALDRRPQRPSDGGSATASPCSSAQSFATGTVGGPAPSAEPAGRRPSQWAELRASAAEPLPASLRQRALSNASASAAAYAGTLPTLSCSAPLPAHHGEVSPSRRSAPRSTSPLRPPAHLVTHALPQAAQHDPLADPGGLPSVARVSSPTEPRRGSYVPPLTLPAHRTDGGSSIDVSPADVPVAGGGGGLVDDILCDVFSSLGIGAGEPTRSRHDPHRWSARSGNDSVGTARSTTTSAAMQAFSFGRPPSTECSPRSEASPRSYASSPAGRGRNGLPHSLGFDDESRGRCSRSPHQRDAVAGVSPQALSARSGVVIHECINTDASHATAPTSTIADILHRRPARTALRSRNNSLRSDVPPSPSRDFRSYSPPTDLSTGGDAGSAHVRHPL